MARGSKELKRRIRTIKSTRQTTRAMEMVSASKLRRAQTAFQSAAPFGRKLSEMLTFIVASGDTPASVLFESRPEIRRRLVVVFAADRGLCGAYNNNLLKMVTRYVAECRTQGIELKAIPVGRRTAEYFTKKQPQIEQLLTIPEHQGRVQVGIAQDVAKRAIAAFESGEVDDVVIIYNKFVSTLVYKATAEKFLPFDLEALEPLSEEERKLLVGSGYIFEPSAEAVFQALLPRFIESKMFVAFASSVTAEHSARMIAMSSATKNCGELIDRLTLQMNKQRQAAITTEIAEIVGGAEALKG